jgi:hypothetical protein
MAENAPDGALDDLVHDCKSEEASDINNGGVPPQIDYLLKSGCMTGDIMNAIVEANRENFENADERD